MPRRPFSRRTRVSDQLLRELAVLVSRELADPRVKVATLTGIEVASDLSSAKVFVTIAEGADNAACLEALSGASGFLRRRLGESMRIRRVPALTFVHDETLDRAGRLDRLLASTLAPEARDTDERESPSKGSGNDC